MSTSSITLQSELFHPLDRGADVQPRGELENSGNVSEYTDQVGGDMTEQEAVAIATQYVDSHEILYERVVEAFFAPASAYGGEIPDAGDSWVVHFANRAPEVSPLQETLSSRGPMVVSVDLRTRKASAVSLL